MCVVQEKRHFFRPISLLSHKDIYNLYYAQDCELCSTVSCSTISMKLNLTN